MLVVHYWVFLFCLGPGVAASFLNKAPLHWARRYHTAARRETTTQKKSSLSAQKGQQQQQDDVVALLHSHHLLDHKPDNMILKGGKFKLRGVGCLGRPGVALCVGPPKSIDKFRSKLQSAMPQKKFGLTAIDMEEEEGYDASSSCVPGDVVLPELDDFEEATLGELRGLLKALDREDLFFTLTGIDPSVASASVPSSDQSGETDNHSKKQKAGKKKRKR
mmetsp:Transcript_24986/g.34957  ORF Transcript_24986/g.34957 Transcript_24986/m.34957 type:complete len:219 (-) Transcript_24986:865-1521(-)